MNILKNISVLVILTILLSSCINFRPLSGCPDGEIDWVDVVMINDIKYQHHFPESDDGNTPLSIEKGSEIGKVTYKMADNACSNHKTKNGDAAYLEKGTPIFEIKGYPSSFVVVANDRVFVAEENKKAKTAGELYAMDQLVKNIYIESTEDGSRMHTFSQSSKDKFLDAWYQLKVEDVERLYRKGKFEGERVFLEIELNNGVTFRELYWADSNTFHSGAIGNKELKEIIDYELSNMK